MMMADVGFMLNVSGSRMATPLAPPRPGSTPMITPSTMPTSISVRLNGVSATWKPCSSEAISDMVAPQARPSRASIGPFGSGVLNQISNIANSTSGRPTDTSSVTHQRWPP